jgi:hypothetical protein
MLLILHLEVYLGLGLSCNHRGFVLRNRLGHFDIYTNKNLFPYTLDKAVEIHFEQLSGRRYVRLCKTSNIYQVSPQDICIFACRHYILSSWYFLLNNALFELCRNQVINRKFTWRKVNRRLYRTQE